jgi:rhamnosyl/mannosyltransferase
MIEQYLFSWLFVRGRQCCPPDDLLCCGFPSHQRAEAFGITLLEGAMYGKALISSEIGTGTTFINIAGETGLVIPPSDPVSLRQAIYYLWNNPEMGNRAEQCYWRYFTAESMGKDYWQLYTNLLANI